MTLILNFIARDYVLQVSDRRLTDLRTGAVIDDESNKATVICGLLSFSYTGPAAIGDEPTDRWLARVVSSAPSGTGVSDVLAGVAREAEAALAQLPYRASWKRLTFAGVGFTINPPSIELEPVVILVSNHLSQTGGWLDEPTGEFGLFRIRFPSPDLPLLVVVPARLSADEHASVARLLRRQVSHGCSSTTVLSTMVDATLRVADRDHTVGRSLMGVAMPRAAVERTIATGMPEPVNENETVGCRV